MCNKHRSAVRWSTNCVSDPMYNTHLGIVNAALDLIKTHDPNIYMIMQHYRPVWRAAIFDADHMNPYYACSSYVGHFYDPDTGKNSINETSPTAASEAATHLQQFRALRGTGDFSDAMYQLGIMLHFATDLTQPMHASNFTNIVVGGETCWFHAMFEDTYIEKMTAKYGSRMWTSASSDWNFFQTATSDFNIFHNIATATKPWMRNLFEALNKEVVSNGKYMWETTLEPVVPLILQRAQTITAALLVYVFGNVTLQNVCDMVNIEIASSEQLFKRSVALSEKLCAESTGKICSPVMPANAMWAGMTIANNACLTYFGFQAIDLFLKRLTVSPYPEDPFALEAYTENNTASDSTSRTNSSIAMISALVGFPGTPTYGYTDGTNACVVDSPYPHCGTEDGFIPEFCQADTDCTWNIRTGASCLGDLCRNSDHCVTTLTGVSCIKRIDGSACHNDAECAEGYCSRTSNTCGKLPDNAFCPSKRNADCANGACAHGGIADESMYVCCPYGKYCTWLDGWCAGKPLGDDCKHNCQCTSDKCLNNKCS